MNIFMMKNKEKDVDCSIYHEKSVIKPAWTGPQSRTGD